MSCLSGAEMVIADFETMPPDSRLRRGEILRMVAELGGCADAVIRCNHEASILAYVAALIERRIITTTATNYQTDAL